MLLSCIQLIRAFTTKLRDDSISAFASQAAFFTILAIFPFLMFLLTLLNYLPFSIDDLGLLTNNIIPESITMLLQTILNELIQKSSGTLLSVSVIAALWSASNGIVALSKGLNAVYHHKETRNYFILRGISAFYTLVFAILLILMLVLLVFGNQLYEFIMIQLPIFRNLAMMVLNLRSLFTMAILTLFFLMVYLVLPNRKSSFFRELPGAIISAGGWLLFSYLFSYYIDNMGNYSYTYGSLAAIAISMLWLYFCMFILFIGAEINMILSHPEVIQATHSLFSRKK